MESACRISTSEEDGIAVLTVAGELELGSAGRAFKKALLDLGDGPPGSFAVIDLTDVTFIDSTGLSALVVAEKHFRRQGRTLRLVTSHPAVRRALEITDLAEVLAIFPTFAEATAVAMPPSARPARRSTRIGR